jgi:hypothetical protein
MPVGHVPPNSYLVARWSRPLRHKILLILVGRDSIGCQTPRSRLSLWRIYFPYQRLLPSYMLLSKIRSSLSVSILRIMSSPISNCTYVPLSSYDWKSVSKPYACHGIFLEFNPAVYSFYTASLSVTFWMAIDLLINVFSTFRRWTTMNFWSVSTYSLYFMHRLS